MRKCQNKTCEGPMDHKRLGAKFCSKRCGWAESSRKNYEKKEEFRKQWRKDNPDKVASYKKKNKSQFGGAYQAKRRAVKKCSYHHLEDLKSIYSLCEKINRATSSNLQVDHIEPLNGVDISGLEVRHNLQLLDGTLNLKKSNRRDFITPIESLRNYAPTKTYSTDAP